RHVRLSLVLIAAACGGASTAQTPVNNAAADPPATQQQQQHFTSMVIEEYAKCTDPHHVTITLDGNLISTVVVPCTPPPVPHNGVVIHDSTPRITEGPAFDIGPGKHRLVVRDVETGLVADHEGVFPIYGSLIYPKPKSRELPVDVLVVEVHVDR